MVGLTQWMELDLSGGAENVVGWEGSSEQEQGVEPEHGVGRQASVCSVGAKLDENWRRRKRNTRSFCWAATKQVYFRLVLDFVSPFVVRGVINRWCHLKPNIFSPFPCLSHDPNWLFCMPCNKKGHQLVLHCNIEKQGAFSKNYVAFLYNIEFSLRNSGIRCEWWYHI